MNTKGILIAILALGSITFTNATFGRNNTKSVGLLEHEFVPQAMKLYSKDKQQPVKEFIETERVKIPPKKIY